jgi:hypothetical protein
MLEKRIFRELAIGESFLLTRNSVEYYNKTLTRTGPDGKEVNALVENDSVNRMWVDEETEVFVYTY